MTFCDCITSHSTKRLDCPAAFQSTLPARAATRVPLTAAQIITLFQSTPPARALSRACPKQAAAKTKKMKTREGLISTILSQSPGRSPATRLFGKEPIHDLLAETEIRVFQAVEGLGKIEKMALRGPA